MVATYGFVVHLDVVVVVTGEGFVYNHPGYVVDPDLQRVRNHLLDLVVLDDLNVVDALPLQPIH
jgi:hypothetical protein